MGDEVYRQECKYCGEGAADNTCPEVTKRGFKCTRKVGHEGSCVACGGLIHRIEVWHATVPKKGKRDDAIRS